MLVPNVPCGVERSFSGGFPRFRTRVPNVPCGVERLMQKLFYLLFKLLFLMYRVELKECQEVRVATICSMFLMYRVELKELKPINR